MDKWTALESTDMTGDPAELPLSGYYMVAVTDIGTATVTCQIETNEQWVNSDLAISDGDDLVQIFAGCAAFRYRFVTDSAGPTVEVGLVDRASYGAPVQGSA